MSTEFDFGRTNSIEQVLAVGASIVDEHALYTEQIGGIAFNFDERCD
jgi:hypothetical protein